MLRDVETSCRPDLSIDEAARSSFHTQRHFFLSPGLRSYLKRLRKASVSVFVMVEILILLHFIFTQEEARLPKLFISDICCHSFSTNISKKLLMSRLSFKSQMMRSISIKKAEISKNLRKWLTKTFETLLQ